jgi:beta-glucosidase
MEGVLVGYRWYDAQHETPAFPFGFGLSYTSFRFSRLTVSRRGGRYNARVTVTNTGKRGGWAVPELYIDIPVPPGLVQAPDQLRGYAKLFLAPGKHRTVTIPLDARSFSYWDTTSQSWRIAPGRARIMVGSSSRSLPLRATVALPLT